MVIFSVISECFSVVSFRNAINLSKLSARKVILPSISCWHWQMRASSIGRLYWEDSDLSYSVKYKKRTVAKKKGSIVLCARIYRTLCDTLLISRGAVCTYIYKCIHIYTNTYTICMYTNVKDLSYSVRYFQVMVSFTYRLYREDLS